MAGTLWEYPQTITFDGTDVIQQLVDRGSLDKEQLKLKLNIENWGIYGGWQKNTGNFAAGKGFKVKVNTKDTLWIYESYPKSTSVTHEPDATNHFRSDFEGNGIDHMNINLVGLPINILEPGDELAIFDGTMCVGAVTLLTTSYKLSINGIPGYQL